MQMCAPSSLTAKKGCIAIWILLSGYLPCIYSTTLMAQIREKHEGSQISRGIQLPPESWFAVPRALQDALTSIDDKLRGLDTFGYTLKLARLDFSLEQLVRRLENIETKLGSLDTKFDLRMEKVEEVVVGKDLKEEFSNEHLIRRMENLNDKFNSKTAFIDAKIDIRMDRISQKQDELEKDLHSSVEEILDRMLKSEERQALFEVQAMDKLQNIEDHTKSQGDTKLVLKDELVNAIDTKLSNMEARLVESSSTIQKRRHMEYSNTLLEKIVNNTQEIETSMRDIHLQVNNSACFNGLTNTRFRSLLKSYDSDENEQTIEKLEKISLTLHKTLNLSEMKFRKLDNDMELYSKKVIGSVQELWKSEDHQRGLIQESLRQGNVTKLFLKERLQELADRLSPLSIVESQLTDLNANLHKKLSDLSTTVDSSFATILVAQNTFISTCRRIQQEESHVYDILKEVVYEMRNRSFFDIQRIGEDIQDMNVQLGVKINHLLDTIFVVGNVTMNRVHDLFGVNNRCDSVQTNAVEGKRQLSQASRDANEIFPISSNDVTPSNLTSQPMETDDVDITLKNSSNVAALKHDKKGNKSRVGLSENIDYDTDYIVSENDYVGQIFE